MGIGVLDEVSTDELRLRLVADETAVGRLRARQMETIRELDRRQTATADGCGSLAEWVAGRADMAPETAQKLVTTAQALGRLEYVADALADGATTYDRAVEVAKIATVVDDLETLVASYDFDIAGLRRQTARRSRVTRRDEEQAYVGTVSVGATDTRRNVVACPRPPHRGRGQHCSRGVGGTR